MGRAYNLTLICSYLVFTNLFVSHNADENKLVENRVNLDPKWKRCGTGKFQSPIDLSYGTSEVLWYDNTLKRTYKPAPAVIKNQGHGITVEWEGDAGGLVKNGTEYKLRQVHWSTPAKHTIEGERYPVEANMVHTNSTGHTIVMTISYVLGAPDPFLAEVLDRIQSENIDAGNVNPQKIQFHEHESYFSFMGSLTVPPCKESVLWHVLGSQKFMFISRTVSQKQIEALKSAVHDDFETNARPTQSWEEKPKLVYLVKNNMEPPDLAPPPPRRG